MLLPCVFTETPPSLCYNLHRYGSLTRRILKKNIALWCSPAFLTIFSTNYAKTSFMYLSHMQLLFINIINCTKDLFLLFFFYSSRKIMVHLRFGLLNNYKITNFFLPHHPTVSIHVSIQTLTAPAYMK